MECLEKATGGFLAQALPGSQGSMAPPVCPNEPPELEGFAWPFPRQSDDLQAPMVPTLAFVLPVSPQNARSLWV